MAAKKKVKKTAKRRLSAAGREAISLAAKRRWARYRKAQRLAVHKRKVG